MSEINLNNAIVHDSMEHLLALYRICRNSKGGEGMIEEIDKLLRSNGKSFVADELKNRDLTVGQAKYLRVKEVALGETFEYLGYHFTGYRPLTPQENNFRKISQRLESDRILGMSQYKWGKNPYSWDEFYAATKDKTIDLFYCHETEKMYIPCPNELFIYRED